MKGFAKFASLILALTLVFSLVSCTDKKKGEEETTSTQSTEQDKTEETRDWGLGIVMPEK